MRRSIDKPSHNSSIFTKMRHNIVDAIIIFKHCETTFESQNIDLYSDFEIPMTIIH